MVIISKQLGMELARRSIYKEMSHVCSSQVMRKVQNDTTVAMYFLLLLDDVC